MEKPLISILVPIYNVEMYLKECLDSIKAQTFSDWECVLVDDGSTDSSPAICDEYAEADGRFKVIHQKNGGVSNARNTALKMAEGKFIGWTDPDDWIEPSMYETLYNLIIENDADISMVGVIKEYRGRQSIKHYVRQRKVIDGKETIRGIGLGKFPSYMCNKLHKREIITTSFPDGRTFEDMFVYGQWLKNVNKVAIDPTPLYHYRMRIGSITHTNPSKNRYDFFLSCIERMKMFDYIQDSNISQDWKNAYINKSAVLAAKRIAREEKNEEVRQEGIQRISNKLNEYRLPSLLKMNPKYWLRAKLLRTNTKSFINLMRVVHFFDFDTKSRAKRYYD
ncbi:MAG: glycosyltransferase [Muribaculaceae bacterium]|nr:glycosyltransferase [Muribaculaceae bacterium]MDE6787457.1 glycosyltransferase [Muribaculaceae bacterium]